MNRLEEFKWCTQSQNGGGAMTTTNNDREVVFGNGYRQKASAGFNTERREFTIVYVGRDYRDVKKFMSDHRLKPFLWRMPDGDYGLFTVKAGTVALTPISSTVQEVKATFTEEFTSMR